MVGPGPSPKRRRADNPAVTAQDVAHANSTLRHFTGQRHNRWMQGWNVAHGSSNGEHTHATAPDRQSSAVSPTRLENATTRPKSNPADHTANAARLPNAAGPLTHAAVQASSSHADTSSNDPVTTTGSSLDKAAMAVSMAHPGLPSPATSDDIGSPNIAAHQQTFPTMMDRERAPTAGPSRPIRPSHPATVATSSTTPQRVHSRGHPPPPQRIMRLSSLPNLLNDQAAGVAAYASPNGTPQGHSPVNSPRQTLSTAPRQSTVAIDDSLLSWAAMLRRFDAFQTGEATTIQLNDVDNGRLTLLREAVHREDLFFVVLSQIHALRNTPQLVPKSAQKLDAQCFRYLDRLLCANEHVSSTVLAWLSVFPAPILSVYFSPQSASVYEPYVIAVTRFLSLLPQSWEQLERQCCSRRAPPLVQELAVNLHLPSPVLQTTAFRAIARAVIDANSFATPELGVQKLEQLHRMDQAGFSRGHRRHPEEMVQAHHAFAKAIAMWKQYEEVTIRYERDARHHPTAGGAPQPAFVFAPEIVHAFQLPQLIEFEPVQQGSYRAVGRNLQQQQASVFQNSQMLSRSARDPFSDSASMPPILPDRAQYQRFSQQTDQQGNRHRQVSRVLPQHLAGRKPLFPLHGDVPRAQPTNPDPNWTALHQAHLRSPKSVPSSTSRANDNTALLYRHMKGFALFPTSIRKDVPVQVKQFTVPMESFEKIPKYSPSQMPGEPPSCSLTEVSETYRLRCATCPTSGFPTEASWIVADGQWPENLFFECNGVVLEPKRKLHHNRYLPIDLSPYIKAGDNHVKIIVNRATNDHRPFEYFIAVEIVGAMSHSSIVNGLAVIRAEDSVEAMKTALSRAHNDDEITVTSSSLTIQLFDPYSNSQIFDLPVRGSACTHRDCFDLEIFLRLCKREDRDGPTVVDCWRCPLCRGDVRPHTLIVDGFLVDVKNQLEQKGALDTRAIVVEADGSWKPKEEERLGVRSPSLEREERGDSATSGIGKKATEVIELD